MSTLTALPEHNLNVGDSYYRHAFERLQALAVKYGEMKAIRPFIDKASYLPPEEAFEHFLQGTEYLRLQGCEEVGCLLGRRFSVQAYGLFLCALLSARNVAHALELLCSYSPKLDYGLHFDFKFVDGNGVLQFYPSVNSQRYPWLLEDWVFGSWNVVKGLCPSVDQPVRIELTMAEPAHRHLYDEVFNCPIVFSAPNNIMLLSSDLLAEQTQSQQENIHHVLTSLFMVAPVSEADELLQKVYQHLLTEMSYTLPTQAEMAQFFGCSLATLKRRLQATGKSYRAIVAEVRMVLAYEYLLMSPMQIKEAAYLLHYDNPGNFCRAFQRWFGESPERFRLSHT